MSISTTSSTDRQSEITNIIAVQATNDSNTNGKEVEICSQTVLQCSSSQCVFGVYHLEFLPVYQSLVVRSPLEVASFWVERTLFQ